MAGCLIPQMRKQHSSGSLPPSWWCCFFGLTVAGAHWLLDIGSRPERTPSSNIANALRCAQKSQRARSLASTGGASWKGLSHGARWLISASGCLRKRLGARSPETELAPEVDPVPTGHTVPPVAAGNCNPGYSCASCKTRPLAAPVGRPFLVGRGSLHAALHKNHWCARPWAPGVPCVRSGLSSRPRLPCSTYGRFLRGRFFVGWPSQIIPSTTVITSSVDNRKSNEVIGRYGGYRFGK